jgi:hypothetical protein
MVNRKKLVQDALVLNKGVNMLNKPSGGRLSRKDVIDLYDDLLKNNRIVENGAAHTRLKKIKEFRTKWKKFKKYYKK